jgi:NAD(P)-dependent dehydrogenase (short-subunit alcohol dehydrogenase family)
MNFPHQQTIRNLEGKVIAITGGFGALGRVTADMLMAKGARVAMLDIAAAPDVGIDSSRLMIGGVDARDPESIAGALSQTVTAFGALHGLVNLAGGFRWEKLSAQSLPTWDRMYAVNLRTAVVACAAVIPHLLATRGRIVNVGAAAAAFANAGMGAYTAAKAGVARLTEALSEELKEQGVNVNAVLPSIIDTPANRADMPDADYKRWVAPADLASVIAFLLSDEATAVTGALIPVKGKV